MESSVLALFLDAPLQSWGYQSRFDQRTSYAMPTRSGILGMAAAAMGLDRNQPDLLKPFEELELMVLAFGPSLRLRDFHTVGGGWDKKTQALHMVNKPGKSPATVVTHREYLQNAKFGILLQGPDTLVKDMAAAFINPVWGIWLGRKSCIPATPVHQGVFQSLEKAEAHLVDMAQREVTQRMKEVDCFGDGTDTLADIPLDFSQRTFAPRRIQITEA